MISVDEDQMRWLDRVHAEKGRPLRVLHLGNIANNGYLNAKFLREIGVDADVFCRDLYHVMASSEWEETEFRRSYGHDYAPDFSARVVGSYGRPNWFFQGPLNLAVSYFASLRGMERERVELGEQLKNPPKPNVLFRFFRFFWRLNLAVLGALGFSGIASSMSYRLLRLREIHFASKVSSLMARHSSSTQADELVQSLVVKFSSVFPERKDRLSREDVAPYLGSIADLQKLFSSYDVVQAYSTEPILPMVAGLKNYVAFEHGTLRDFIRENNGTHRMTALAYRQSAHVFITNGDCFQHAEWLKCERVSPMIHPVDVDKHRERDEIAILALRAHYDADVILFCPLRHDWSVKGTDVHLRALPKILEALPKKRLALVLTPWGLDVDDSRQLIKSLGCEHAVRWVDQPLPRRAFIRHLQAADVVLDQMALPHFGATAPQALAAGTPVVMSYRHESVTRIVSASAPIISAFSADDVAAAVQKALDPSWRADFALQAKDWVDRHHHPERLVREHLNVYRQILETFNER